MHTIKKYLLPIVIIILIVLGIFFVYQKNKSQKVETPVLDFNEHTAREVFGKEDSYIKHLCYLYEEPVDFVDLGKVIYNREYIDMTIVDGEIVSGTHDIVPAGSQSNNASFVGATDGQYINVIASARSDGKLWQEQRVYKRAEGRLYVGYQSTPEPQVKNENGVFMYTQDIKVLNYETDEFYLKLIDCEELKRKVTPQEKAPEETLLNNIEY